MCDERMHLRLETYDTTHEERLLLNSNRKKKKTLTIQIDKRNIKNKKRECVCILKSKRYYHRM